MTLLAPCDSKAQGPGVLVWGADSTPRQSGAGPGGPSTDEPTATWQRASPWSGDSEWPRSSSPGPGRRVGSGKQQRRLGREWPGKGCRRQRQDRMKTEASAWAPMFSKWSEPPVGTVSDVLSQGRSLFPWPGRGRESGPKSKAASRDVSLQGWVGVR